MRDAALMQQRASFDTLRWLLASLALVLALHIEHLPPWLTLLAIVLELWRYAIASRRLSLPSLRILLPLTLAGIIGILITYHGLFARSASVALLALMLALKTLETQNRRDVMLLVFLSYFLTVTSFLFSQSLTFGLFTALPVGALTITLIGVNHPNGDLSWRRKGRLAASMLGQAAPVMLALFLLFPRVPGPLWGVTQDSYTGITGLSDSMAPGSISQLGRSDAVAFRVVFQGTRPQPSTLYWRGLVFWHYDGRSWRPGDASHSLPQETMQAEGAALAYTVTLEPHNKNWLFLLDMPALAPAVGRLNHDYQVLSREPVRQRIRYDGTSYLHYTLSAELDDDALALALQLPLAGNPKARSLAQSWTASGATSETIVQRALTMFHEQPFVYTLTPPLLRRDAMDEFLFGTRSGFCEHYAGSFVFLMRASGVPARVVTGYQGGEFNPAGNYLLVRQSDAHAWAEVWLEGRGWVRVDPTAAVSPQRVEAGVAAALPASEPLPIFSIAKREYPMLSNVYLLWDYANFGWNQWVLGYNQKRQMELLSRLAGSAVSWQDMAIGLMLAVSAVVLVISLALLRGGRNNIDPAQRLYLRFLRKLARAGVTHPPQEGPLDLAQRAAHALPARAGIIRQICAVYAELRYGRGGMEKLAQLRQLLKEL
ncbi:MAG: DUF3488 domain-containing protein [Nitrosomonadales bacterium]|nr:MAG: DUF3488 domain-containing protein [Nitrosomonadales bacterium]